MNNAYDKWLLWDYDGICNLECEYCGQVNRSNRASPPIYTSTLLKALAGHVYRIHFAGGGEPFLIEDFINACKAITAGHFISMNTNLTISKVGEFAESIDPLRVVEIHASLHYSELVRRGLLERYIVNFLLLKDRGFPVVAKCVAYPPLAPIAGQIKKSFKERGIDVSFHAFNGLFENRVYPQSYTRDDMKHFGLPGDFMEELLNKGKPCNAGFNSGFVHKDGNITYCKDIRKSIGHIYGKIRFEDTGVICPYEYCDCPLKNFDARLFGITAEARHFKTEE